MEVSQEELQEAIRIASNARKNAFVIRSNHPIGACVITSDSHFYGGCNTESDISGFGVCAERSAIDHAIVHGKFTYKAMVVVDESFTDCCGACLQYMELFSQINNQNILVYSAKVDGTYIKSDLKSLLPHGYLTKDRLGFIQSYKNKQTPPFVEE